MPIQPEDKMTLAELIEYLENLCHANGESTDYGCPEADIEHYKGIARSQHPGWPICVVSDWKWIDTQTSIIDPEHLDRIKVIDVQYICAKTILEDEAGRRFRGVVTSVLTEFTHGCIFKTRNTTYILVGTGLRISLPPFMLHRGNEIFPFP